MESAWIIQNNHFAQAAYIDSICQSNGSISLKKESEKTPCITNIADVYANRPEIKQKQLSILPDWTDTFLILNDERVQLSTCEILSFNQTFNYKYGLSEKQIELKSASGYHIEFLEQRFVSLSDKELGLIHYHVKSIDFEGKVSFTPVINADFPNENFPTGEPEWNVLQSRTLKETAHLWIQIRHTHHQVCEVVSYDFLKNNAAKNVNPTKIEKMKKAGFSFGVDLKKNEYVSLHKYVALLSTENHPYTELTAKSQEKVLAAKERGWKILLSEHEAACDAEWQKRTSNSAGMDKASPYIIKKNYQEIFLNTDAL